MGIASKGDLTMTPIRPTLTIAAAAFALLAFTSTPSFARGSFDGTWVVDVPASQTLAGNTQPACPASRFPLEIRDNVVYGSLERVYSGGSSSVVETGTDKNARPVFGTVQPDGSVTAAWLDYHATGKLNASDGAVTINSACGPRKATVVRVN
jgi:hypothetical protein